MKLLPSKPLRNDRPLSAVDRIKSVTLKDSWGVGWGEGGYGTLPFDDVTAFNRQMWDAFDIGYSSQIGLFPGAI